MHLLSGREWVWEDPSGLVLVAIWNPEPQVCLVSQSHRQARVTACFQFSVHISVGKSELGTALPELGTQRMLLTHGPLHHGAHS